MTPTQADREAARQFIVDEWPSWDSDHCTVQAELIVRFTRHRLAAEAAAFEKAEAMCKQMMESDAASEDGKAAAWNLMVGMAHLRKLAGEKHD